MDYIAFIFTALSVIGTAANSFQKRWCFYVWSITNVFWCIYNALNGMWAQSLLYAFNFSTCIIGLRKWRNVIEWSDAFSCFRGKNYDCYQTPKTTGENNHENCEVLSEMRRLTKLLCSSLESICGADYNFVIWQIKQGNSRVKHLAYNASSRRTRKKNQNRLVREYKKALKRSRFDEKRFCP